MRERIDRLLVSRGLAPSRERAQRLVMTGGVRIGDRVVDKPGTMVDAEAEIRVVGADLPYVSRGGLKLEAALARLRTNHLIALLHYSPVQGTVEGEPLEIYPLLGSSRLEEPIGRYPVSLVVHGHAHRGQLEGRTKNGVPVYNVSMPLLTRTSPDRPPFRIFEA